ncbi:MAG: V-type ATPase subunit [Gammaproteobacteria bacterium]|nr:V-type ATPase subunit [Gammaproteobacteria bacterium]
MSDAAGYAYLHGRTSVLAAQLLSPLQLENLIQLPLGQETEVLLAAGITDFHPGETAISPRTREQRLITILLDELLVLTRAVTSGERDFLIYWAYRFELSNLKTLLRGKLNGQDAATIREEFVDMGSFARLPLETLLRTEDVAEVLRQLEEGTAFADLARQVRRIFEERHEPFALDAAIDRQYFAGLAKRARSIKGGASGPLRKLVGGIIDRLNLVWLLRYRLAYGLSPAETYYLLIPSSYRLSRQVLQALSQLNSFEEIMAQLPAPFSKWLAQANNTTQVTYILERESWRLAESVLRRSAFNLARAFAYLLLRERDLRRVRAAIKGKRLKLAPELIREAAGITAAPS